MPGLPFNTAAAEARSTILGVLRAWAGLVAGERAFAVPRDTAAGIAEFLLRHSEWLVAHEAAGELSEEVARAVRRAQHVIDPSQRRHLRVGTCVEADCGGTLTATVLSDRSRPGVEVACDADTSHRWSAQEWMRSSRAVPVSRTEPAGPLPLTSAVRWLGVRDISLLWGIASGSVYRHASQQRWRRRTDNGRVSYHEEDVLRSLGAGAVGRG
ncbi:hypothetical protein [Kitasatospora sp. NPDC091207]|uniref:hypothetical protein n=1 Tax=Kitasatospora sp. NPDC091207 TaxID=3364083 RepID=UPI00382D36CB